MSAPVLASRRAGWVLTGSAALGLAAAFALAVEKVLLLRDPFYVPSCSFDERFSCATVMQSAQSEVFGFPNPYLGLVGFTVVLTLGVGLVAGVGYPRWIWGGLAAGVVAATGFVGWLAYQSIVVIGALCPYCMVVWAVVAVLLVTVLVTRPGSRSGLPPPAEG